MAVYTPVTEEQLTDFLAVYDVGALERFEGIRQGVENTNYHVFTDRGRYILTLFEGRTDINNLPFFFALTDHLGKSGVRCPLALEGRDGEIIREIAGKPAALISFLEGRDTKKDDITPDHCAQVGDLLARMHRAAENFEPVRSNSVGFSEWCALTEKVGERAETVEAGLMARLKEELEWLEAHWPAPGSLPAGAVHVDLFPDNVFFEGGTLVGAIDFYFACTDFYAYDLAVTVGAWCFDGAHELSEEKHAAFMTAYESVRPLSEEEKAALPVLRRGAAMRFLSSRLHDEVFHDPESFVTPHDPREYIAKLKFWQGFVRF